MTSPFYIKEHLVEGQHIREYPNATTHSQEEVLYLSVKQYIPKDNLHPKPGDVTIIASHANGFVKVRIASHADHPALAMLTILYRNYMSHYGRTSLGRSGSKVLRFEAYG